MKRLLLALSLTSACLSAPEPRQPPDGEPFPPDSFELHDVWVVTANSDQRDDLLVARFGDPSNRGLYFLLGDDQGIGDRSHAFVNTPTPPLSATLADLGGDPASDLMVLTSDEDRAHLLLYPGTDELAFGSPWSKEITLQVVPQVDGEETFLARYDLDGDADPDFLFGNATDLFTIELPEWSELGFGDMQPDRVVGPNSTRFYGARLVFPLLADADGDPDLCVVDSFETYLLVGDGTGKYAADEGVTSHLTVPSVSPVHFAGTHDVDGDGVLDVFGGYNGFLGLTQPWPIDATYQWPDGWFTLLGEVVDFQVVDLDHDPAGRAELVVLEDLEHAGTGRSARLMIWENLYLGGDPTPELRSNTNPLEFELAADFHAVLARPGDFDGDGRLELMVFDSAGHSRCLRQVPGDTIEPC